MTLRVARRCQEEPLGLARCSTEKRMGMLLAKSGRTRRCCRDRGYLCLLQTVTMVSDKNGRAAAVPNTHTRPQQRDLGLGHNPLYTAFAMPTRPPAETEVAL